MYFNVNSNIIVLIKTKFDGLDYIFVGLVVQFLFEDFLVYMLTVNSIIHLKVFNEDLLKYLND